MRYALRLHAGQRRESDGAAFVLHPLEVASLLHHVAYPDHVVAAGILHDTIEDGPATIQTIEARFGEAVAAIDVAADDRAQ